MYGGEAVALEDQETNLTQREFTAKLAVDRTKLVGMYISMVDFLGSMQSG